MFEMKRGRGWRSRPVTVETDMGVVPVYPLGLFIKHQITVDGEACPYDIYRRVREIGKQYEGLRIIRYGYQNIRNYFYWLKSLGYITFKRSELTRIEERKVTLAEKRYYELTAKGRREEEGWFNPRRTLYPKSWGKRK